jgi:carbonic anhydrase
VQAALSVKDHDAEHPERIALLLDNILPGLEGLDGGPPEARMAAAVEANVRWSMHQLLETPEARARVEAGHYRLVGAVYQLTTGRVRFLT